MTLMSGLPTLAVPQNRNMLRGASKPQAPRMEAADKEATVYVYDVIDSWGFDINTFAVALQEAGDLARINVRINSPGGNAFDGAAVYNLLKEHKAEIVVKIDGQAASAASIIAMAGDQILMGEAAEIMIHNPWVFVIGDSNELIKVADDLKKMEARFARAYAKRSGQDEKKIRTMMDEETYMGPDEAIELGFATGMLLAEDGPDDAQAATRKVNLRQAYRERFATGETKPYDQLRQHLKTAKLKQQARPAAPLKKSA